MDHERPWAQAMAAAVGQRVARYRTARHVSAQQLADRCAELGMPSISRVVITRLENGRRDSVSTAEVTALAAALRVPPVELLFDVRDRGDVEVLPGVFISQWQAVLWFVGKYHLVPRVERSPILDTGWPSDAALAERHLLREREAADLETQAIEAAALAREAGAGPLTELGARATYRRDAASRSAKLLAALREQMRRRGFEPPPLSATLAHVDASVAIEEVIPSDEER